MTGQADFSLIVGYGTDMGNAEDAAMSFAAEAIELNQIELAELQSATHFVVVTSTFGDHYEQAAAAWTTHVVKMLAAENTTPPATVAVAASDLHPVERAEHSGPTASIPSKPGSPSTGGSTLRHRTRRSATTRWI